MAAAASSSSHLYPLCCCVGGLFNPDRQSAKEDAKKETVTTDKILTTAKTLKTGRVGQDEGREFYLC